MIAILKYNAGNIKSVQNALSRLGYESIITNDPQQLLESDKLIFPGVGEASSAMQYLRERDLDQVLLKLNQPVLGICLGLQLMCEFSDEGNTEGLGIFKTQVKKFPSSQIVPHMGWNEVEMNKSPLMAVQNHYKDYYFVHSFYAEVCEDTVAICNYGQAFSAALQKDNFYATQFHPEKSAKAGESILQNFLSL